MTSEIPEPMYDMIIVGSGIAGLYTAVEVLKRHPKIRLAIFEKYRGVGGRAYTFRTKVDGKHVQWEAGAGRISEMHERLLGLMKHYGLTWIPIGANILYKEDADAPFEPNMFESGIPIMLDTIAGLPAEELATHTIRQLLTRIHGAATTEKYLIRFPYRAEVDIMRADMAIRSFRGEMRRNEGYGICKEGLSALVKAMREEIERRKGHIFTHHELVGYSATGAKAPIQLEFRVGAPDEGVGRPLQVVSAEHVVLAIPVAAIRQLNSQGSCPSVKDWTGLKHLRMAPLLRFYGVFPKDENGKLWYEEYGGRVVTATPVRYMIGGNPAQGTCQISYTDSQDADYWIQKLDEKGEREVGEEILGQLRRLLKPSIPAPKMMKAHAWREGATYWLPGNYDPAAVSQEAITPFPEKMPGLHICGESFSLRQAWIEGALEHAAALVKVMHRKLSTKSK
jgi:monoamine oxidase